MAAGPPPARAYTPDLNAEIGIVHADDDIIVANKPAGLLSVPGRGPDKSICLVSLLEAEFRPLSAPHRLDMDTSGLIMLARHEAAHRALSKAFEARLVEKAYIALVAGDPGGESGEIDFPIGRDWADRPRRCIDHDNGKPSRTGWRKLSSSNGVARLELTPHTGRTHQLRVHCAAIGHPIIGDRLYGKENETDRLCLHASRLAFAHPISGATIVLEAAPDF